LQTTAAPPDPIIDQLSGRIDLSALFDAGSAQRLIDALAFRGAATARSPHAVCATIGAPRFDDRDAKNAAQEAGPAAGFLSAWNNNGVEATAQVRGAYAVAIADAASQSLFLAVDRFSINTLCYCLDEQTISFSDRADCVEGRGLELDPQAIFDYLFFHMIPAPRTIFSKVRRLPAAHCLLIDPQGVQEIRHWPGTFDEGRQHHFTGARDSFRGLIREAIADELPGQRRVGAFLSGGTDSSTVAGMLGEVSGAQAPAYSIGFEAEGYDEMEYARIAARHFGCEHHEYYVTPADLVTSIPAVARHFDQPFGNSSALPAYYCAKMAKEDGCTKLLAGDGGDELFGGNTRYAAQRVFELYHAVPKGMRGMIEPLCGDDSVLRKIPGLRQATGYVRHSRITLPDRLQSFNLIMQLDPAKVLCSDFLAQIEPAGPSAHMRSTWDQCQADSLINRMLAYDWRYTLADSDLPKVRGAASLAGIDVGYPLLADRLTDFSMTLPPDWKLRRFKLRWFFKESLRGFLPEQTIAKKKQGFGLPFGVWATRHPKLKQLAEDSLHSLAERGIVRRDFIDRLFADYLPEHPGYYGEMVWILMMLEEWLRGHQGVRLAVRSAKADFVTGN
jgi:asparagine synthase (glutamine-hydrolysing)